MPIATALQIKCNLNAIPVSGNCPKARNDSWKGCSGCHSQRDGKIETGGLDLLALACLKNVKPRNGGQASEAITAAKAEVGTNCWLVNVRPVEFDVFCW